MVGRVLCLGLSLLLTGSLWKLPSLAVAYSQWLSPVSTDPRADIAVALGGDRVDTTFAEAQALAGQLQKTRLPHGSLVLVSDAYHLRRSRWVVAHYLSCCFEGAEVGLKTAATVPLTLEDHRRWWRDGGQRLWVVSESQKLVFYWLYYGLLGRRQSWNVPVESLIDWLVDGASPVYFMVV